MLLHIQQDKVKRAQWSRFTASLAAGDVERALTLVGGDGARARYRPALELIRPVLSEYAASLAGLHLQELRGSYARYLVIRTEEGQKRGYAIFFAPDAHGIWRIIQF